MREAPDALRRGALFDRPFLDRLLGRRRRIDLIEADRLGNRRFGRDELLREIEWDARDELELVACDLAVDDGAEPGVGLEQSPKVRLLEDEQLRRSNRLDADGARGAEEQRALAEEVAAPDLRNVPA